MAINKLCLESGGTWQDVSPTDLDNDLQLRQQTERIYNSYQQASQKAIIAMNDWVRQHQEMFLEIKQDR
nr:hypothetical protein [Paenibacillus xylanexedens]